ncbi:hypothetical protein M405DRAFT_265105 [Rhizopogon salebrosus TDB-379]|nr:hypothetical protein M405DRAFT_265105 [Rhizopogon salebrosus TDB-379]
MELRSYPSSPGNFLLLTFLMKLCLLRGLIVAVKIAFMSEDIDAKNWTHGPPRPVHDSPSSFECLLCEWNVWLRLRFSWSPTDKQRLKYSLGGIIFGVGLCHVQVSDSLCDLQNKRTLLRLYVGDWTALPPLQDVPFMAFVEAGVEQIWDSPPTEDQNPREVETTQKQSDEDDSSSCCMV